jgi:hypothetical protein
VSEIKIGDKGVWKSHKVVVKGIDGDVVWVKLGPGDYVNIPTPYFTPAPKTFEFGKTYRHNGNYTLQFFCGGLWGSAFSGELRMMANIVGHIHVQPAKFSDWEEI